MKAPRGPIKSREPLETAHPMERSRCTATNRQGTRCGKPPIRGGTVCRNHGGAAPQVKAAAERRLQDLRPAAIQYLDWLVSQRDYPSAGLGAAKDILDRNDGRPAESVDMRLSGQVDVVSVLRQRQARRAESLDKMAPVHHTDTDAGSR